ncbi:MAG: phenylalanine--tRNA ligase subunit beta [Rhodospirillales bacterium]|nr:phenylalanine--tRNA ligase subunit beta [Rhodospirillales bacterium]
MKFTLNWLKDHLDTSASLDEIALTLTRIGLEVIGIENPAEALTPFVIGEIITAEKHPNADKLQVCQVKIGKDQLVEVVCGAPNARPGLKTAFAAPGSVIPASGEVLKIGAIRGVTSNGMLCSTRELKLGEDHEGIMELPADAIPGAPIGPLLGLDDPVIEINLTPNRADCAGVRGVARDLAAAGLGALKPLSFEPVSPAFGGSLKVVIEDQTACPLFLGRTVRGVKNGPSPKWLADRLTAIGLNPRSALVDVTNYFTFDRCRPLHVFDAAKVHGDTLTVRSARTGEVLEALNGKSYTLEAGMTVIADSEGVDSLGGIMGGMASGCTAETSDIYIECALFDPRRTAETGRALQISSDARYRFERGLDPQAVFEGMAAATRMILELCGGEASEIVVAGAVPEWKRTIAFRPSRVASLGGVGVPPERQRAILTALGCGVAIEGASFAVNPPSWRADIEGEADLVEEVLRIEGYDRIPETPLPRLRAIARPAVDAAQRRVPWAKRLLASRGLNEAVTWSFIDGKIAKLFGTTDSMTLLNPISADLSTMRPTILANLIQAATRNAARGYVDAALFEVGPIFNGSGPEGAGQSTVATGIRTGFAKGRHWTGKAKPVDPFDAKSDALALLSSLGVDPAKLTVDANPPSWFHPGQAGLLKLGPIALGTFGTIHPDILDAIGLDGACVGFTVDLGAVPMPRRKGTARPALSLSQFQPITRDFAFVVAETVPAEKLIRAVKGADKAIIVDARLFDLYTGPGVEAGMKSLAIEVTLQPAERTFTDADIEAVAARIVAAAAKDTGATLRG